MSDEGYKMFKAYCDLVTKQMEVLATAQADYDGNAVRARTEVLVSLLGQQANVISAAAHLTSDR